MPQPTAGAPLHETQSGKDSVTHKVVYCFENPGLPHKLSHVPRCPAARPNQSCSHIRIERQTDGRCLAVRLNPRLSRVTAADQHKLCTIPERTTDSRWPPPTPERVDDLLPRRARGQGEPGAAIGPQPLQHFHLAGNSSVTARPLIPATRLPAPIAAPASVLLWRRLHPCAHPTDSRPLQHTQMASLSSAEANSLIPRAALLSRPLQHVQVSAKSRSRACALIPWTAVRSQPLQHTQVTAHSSVIACSLNPRTAIRPRPL